jgi:fused signal recognition particle receptor
MFSFFSKSKISGTTSKIATAISQIFTHKKLDDETLEELEEALIINDVGSEATKEIITNLKKNHFEKNISDSEIKEFLSGEILKILRPCQKTLQIKSDKKPQVIIFNGVNGAGKTTTIGKIAANLKKQNQKILIAACDTFRAAATQQLEVWAKRVDCEIILPQKENEDPASVAFRALDYAKKNGFDILLIDTAGRLQNKQGLMEELRKINVVLKKLDDSAPHENLLILDGTTGQNAKIQMEVFDKIVNISGLVVTKLDGSTKGGIVVALAKNFAKPIYAIGVGEKIEDLQEFNAESFSRNLVGLN